MNKKIYNNTYSEYVLDTDTQYTRDTYNKYGKQSGGFFNPSSISSSFTSSISSSTENFASAANPAELIKPIIGGIKSIESKLKIFDDARLYIQLIVMTMSEFFKNFKKYINAIKLATSCSSMSSSYSLCILIILCLCTMSKLLK